MTDLDELERLAKAATPGPWCVKYGEWIIPAAHADRGIGGADDPVIDREKYAQYFCHIPKEHRHRSVYEQDALRGYIAACSPDTVLRLVRAARALVAVLTTETGAEWELAWAEAKATVEYTGKSIPEHITELRAEVAALKEIIVDARDWVSVLDEADHDAANCALRLQWLPRARSV